MQQAKIRKCNWESYDMVANPSVDMKALIITNRRVFGFIKRVRSGDLVFCTCFLLMQIAQVLVLGLFANDIIVQIGGTPKDYW
ncbi:hypothetical protein HUJ04_005450 [Dendroctonus ponderosae]|nr:hypothetical protein HUJ04_005450 [Dendroctonus ponderosae]